MLFVPREPFPATLPGLAPPRAVPSDLIVATLSRALPADILQKLILLAIFVLACSGAAALLDREPIPARLAAGIFYTWNPYVAERLIIGHWALLLGYAGLPWALRAVLAPDLASPPTARHGPPASQRAARPTLTTPPGAARPTRAFQPGVARLALALLPAAIGGFAALAITALVAAPVALFTRSARRAAVVLAALTISSLPWLIPSLLHQVYVDPASVAAFAARPDTPFGSIGSLLMLGGQWNAQTVPQAYGGPWSTLWLAAVIVALAAYLLLARPQHRWPGLAVAAVIGLVIAALGVTAPGRDLLRSLIAAWPGFAILRDAQQYVAPLALLESVGFGLAAARALHPRPSRTSRPSDRPLAPSATLPRSAPDPLVRPSAPGSAFCSPDPTDLSDPAGPPDPAGLSDPAGPPDPAHLPDPADRPGTRSARPARADLAGILLVVLAALSPILLLPGLAWGAAGRLRPAWYPATWLAAARTLDASRAPGSVLLLPWATYRTPSWNHAETVFDPWTRLLSRPLIWNDGTQVGPVALLPDDPQARRLDAAIDSTGSLTATLRAAHIRFVLDDANRPQAQVAARLPGSVMIINLPGLTVYQLPA